jgi:hypothetical protein
MANREELIDDNEEWVDRREPRVQPNTRIGRRELSIFNGREDPTRFLARYSLACRANNEGAPEDLVRIFPLALAGTAADWFLDMDVPERLTWQFLSQAFVKRFGTDKLLDSPIRRLSTIKMKHNENVREYIDRFNRIRHTCENEPHLTHTVTWFISGLSRGIRRELKKASTYSSLTEVYDAAMEVEDEYAASGDDIEVDREVRKGNRSSVKGFPSLVQGSSSNIGADEVREIAREVTRQNQEEVLQAIEKKLHITGERE